MKRSPPSSTGRPWVDAGRLCVDFVMTGPATELCARYAKFERLAEPADLSRWLKICALDVHTQATPADLRRAKGLRDALWHLTDAETHRSPGSALDLALLNESARGAPLVPQLVDGARSWSAPTPRQALVAVARDAVELYGHREQLARLRECASDDCPRPFYDTSRAGVRRWCDPVRCGDRERARRYRAHQRED